MRNGGQVLEYHNTRLEISKKEVKKADLFILHTYFALTFFSIYNSLLLI